MFSYTYLLVWVISITYGGELHALASKEAETLFLKTEERLFRGGEEQDDKNLLEIKAKLDQGVQLSKPLIDYLPTIAVKRFQLTKAEKQNFYKGVEGELFKLPLYLRCSFQTLLESRDDKCLPDLKNEADFIAEGSLSAYYFYRALSGEYINRFEFVMASDALYSARRALDQLGNHPILELNLLMRQGIVNVDYAPIRSIAYHHEALQIAKQNGYHAAIIAQLINLTKTILEQLLRIDAFPKETAQKLQPWKEKLSILMEETLEVSRGGGYEPHSKAIAGLYHEIVTKNYVACINFYDQARQAFLKGGLLVWASDSLLNMGSCHLELGDLDSAQDSLNQAKSEILAHLKEGFTDREELQFIKLQARIEQKQKRFSEAIKSYQRANAIEEKIKFSSLVSQFSQQSALTGLAASEREKDSLERRNLQQKEQLRLAEVVRIVSYVLVGLIVILIGLLLRLYHIHRDMKSKSKKILKQTKEIHIHNLQMRSIISNVDEAIIQIHRDQRIHCEFSDYANHIFGESLHGQVFDVAFLEKFHMRKDDASRIVETIRAVLGSGNLTWELNKDQLPFKIKHAGQVFSLLWNGVMVDGQVDHILLVARDLTHDYELSKKTELAERRLDDMTSYIREIISNDADGAFEVVRSSINYFRQHQNDRDELKIFLHSQKSLARVYGLSRLAEAIHRWEENEPDLRSANSSFEASLSPYQELLHLFHRQHQDHQDDLFEIMSQAIKMINPELKEVGFELGTTAINMDGKILSQEFSEIRTIVLHCINNCLDHGYLRPFQKGLIPRKKVDITIDYHELKDERILRIEDQGVGLDSNLIRRLAAGTSDSSQVLFQEGFTTADATSLSSGRGTGLNAVRRAVTNLGGEVTIYNNKSKPGATVECRWPKVRAVSA